MSATERAHAKVGGMKILLTGASGLLGRALMPHLALLAGTPDNLIGTAHSRLRPPLQRLDLTDDTAKNKPLANAAVVKIVYKNGIYSVPEIGTMKYVEAGKQALNNNN